MSRQSVLSGEIMTVYMSNIWSNGGSDNNSNSIMIIYSDRDSNGYSDGNSDFQIRTKHAKVVRKSSPTVTSTVIDLRRFKKFSAFSKVSLTSVASLRSLKALAAMSA